MPESLSTNVVTNEEWSIKDYRGFHQGFCNEY